MERLGVVMQKDDAAEKLDTPREIAALIRTTPQTVLNYHRAGIIPARINVGRVIRFNSAEVLAALATHSKNAKREDRA